VHETGNQVVDRYFVEIKIFLTASLLISTVNQYRTFSSLYEYLRVNIDGLYESLKNMLERTYI
jgi:hypothetical protein